MTSLLPLADARFVSLTTFRRSGEPVSTPVWVGREGGALVVLTPAGSGKVTRLRSDPRVGIRPCGRFGKVPDGVDPVAGTAELPEHPADVERARATIRRTYPSSPGWCWGSSGSWSGCPAGRARNGSRS